MPAAGGDGGRLRRTDVLRGQRPISFTKEMGKRKVQREAQPSLWTPSLSEGRSPGTIKIKIALRRARMVQT